MTEAERLNGIGWLKGRDLKWEAIRTHAGLSEKQARCYELASLHLPARDPEAVIRWIELEVLGPEPPYPEPQGDAKSTVRVRKNWGRKLHRRRNAVLQAVEQAHERIEAAFPQLAATALEVLKQVVRAYRNRLGDYDARPAGVCGVTPDPACYVSQHPRLVVAQQLQFSRPVAVLLDT